MSTSTFSIHLPQKPVLIEIVLLFAVWTAVLIFAGTPYPYDYDSVNLALGIVDSFNPAIHQPHPPGYFFHIVAGRIIYSLSRNPFRAIEIQNVLHLLLFAAVIVRAGARGGMIFMLGSFPLLLLLTAAPLIHAALAGFGSLLCYLAIAMHERRLSPVVLAAAFAIAIGFRQDIAAFMLPIVVYSIIRYRPSIKELLAMALVFSAITLCWFIPTTLHTPRSPVSASGGMFMTFAPNSTILLGASPWENLRWSIRSFMFFLGAIGPAGLVFYLLVFRRIGRTYLPILLIGVLPCLIFLLVIHGPKPGYYALPIGFSAAWIASSRMRPIKPVLLIILACINILFFIFMPGSDNATQERFAQRTPAGNIRRQFLFAGSNTLPHALAVRKHYAYADSAFGSQPSFVPPPGLPLEKRGLNYMARWVWHNEIGVGPHSTR